jgi:hypothetical protein
MILTCLLLVLLSLVMSTCSSVQVPTPTYVTPSAPTDHAAIVNGAKSAAGEAHLAPPFEVSAVRPTDHGLGRYYVCVRGTSTRTGKRDTYVAFFDNNTYKGSRNSVIIEACETQAYEPLP